MSGLIGQETEGAITNFFRGAKPGEVPSFAPRLGEFKVDAESGLVLPTHGLSVFNNAESVLSKGYDPYKLDLSSLPSELQIIQRGKDISHFEIAPASGVNLTPEQFSNALCLICIK